MRSTAAKKIISGLWKEDFDSIEVVNKTMANICKVSSEEKF